MKGRGADSLLPGRFARTRTETFDDGWPEGQEPAPAQVATTVAVEQARSIISRNNSPDIPFDQSVNPYRGCEHGCIYCYARPSHAYLDLSPGLDFETRLVAKANTVELLRSELGKAGYQPSPINLGANTDPFQPIESDWRLSGGVLDLLLECRHPLTIVTKNGRIEAELPVLRELAKFGLVHVFVSVTSLDNRLAAILEPRASAPHRRIRAIARLHENGIPVSVLVAPVIPAITDAQVETVLKQARAAGAQTAGYTLLRLPWEVRPLFESWLKTHFPQRAEHVMSLMRQMRGGQVNDPQFGSRMRGTGVFATLLRQRFQTAARRLGFARRSEIQLDCNQFRPPRTPGAPEQLSLF